jgi:hypothetical protein
MFLEAVEDCCSNSRTTAWTGPEGTKAGAPKFQDSQHMQVVRLSAAFTPQQINVVFISVRRWVDPRTKVWLESDPQLSGL